MEYNKDISYDEKRKLIKDEFYKFSLLNDGTLKSFSYYEMGERDFFRYSFITSRSLRLEINDIHISIDEGDFIEISFKESVEITKNDIKLISFLPIDIEQLSFYKSF